MTKPPLRLADTLPTPKYFVKGTMKYDLEGTGFRWQGRVCSKGSGLGRAIKGMLGLLEGVIGFKHCTEPRDL